MSIIPLSRRSNRLDHRPAWPAAEVVDLNLMRLAAALHRLGETIGADVGSRKDMLKRLAAPAHEARQ